MQAPEHALAITALREAEDKVSQALGAPIGPAIQAGELLAALASSQAPYLERLRALGPPLFEVPWFPPGRRALQATRRVADALKQSTEEPAA